MIRPLLVLTLAAFRCWEPPEHRNDELSWGLETPCNRLHKLLQGFVTPLVEGLQIDAGRADVPALQESNLALNVTPLYAKGRNTFEHPCALAPLTETTCCPIFWAQTAPE